MSVTANLTTNVETITATIVVEDETIIAQVNTAARGPAGSAVIDAATTSDGTADLDLLNVETVTATVIDTLTAPHIHGNLAGSVYAHIRAGETLAKGDPVYVSSSFGSGSTLIPIVSRADASSAAKMPAVGIMDEDVANNLTGHMVITGTITELNTTGLTVNAELYVAAGGGMTATPPTARAQPVARVERVNANNGAVIVKVNGLSASDATGNTLVRRDAIGGASFVGLNTSTLDSAGITTTGQVEFNGTDAGDSLTFNMVNYSYGAGAASAHRTALGLGTGDIPLFSKLRVSSAASTAGATNYGIELTFLGSFITTNYPAEPGNSHTSLSQNGVAVRHDKTFGWANNASFAATGAMDLRLEREASGTLAQRNGLNQQESRIYGTYSDTSNYRRLALKMSTTGVAQIVAEGLGTGAVGNRIEIDGLRIGKGGGDIATNTALGASALNANTSGQFNSAVGDSALLNNTTGGTNSAVGVSALTSNGAGSSNSAIGFAALSSSTSGSNNSAVGHNAGRFIADGTTANTVTNNSVYLGATTKALASNQTNQIVIGHNATGIGSNTAVLGNDSIVTTALKGNVGIGTTSPSALLDVNSNTVRVRTARTPASAAAAGNAGDICWDADYIYVCTAANTWKRTAISTWP